MDCHCLTLLKRLVLSRPQPHVLDSVRPIGSSLLTQVTCLSDVHQGSALHSLSFTMYNSPVDIALTSTSTLTTRSCTSPGVLPTFHLLMPCHIASVTIHAGSGRTGCFSTIIRRKQLCLDFVHSATNLVSDLWIDVAAFSLFRKRLCVTVTLDEDLSDIGYRRCRYQTRTLRHIRSLINLCRRQDGRSKSCDVTVSLL